MSKRQILLVFEGLDTVATILVNNIKVGQSSNMFHRYIFDVKGALKTGLNTIKVDFTSAVLYGKGQAKKSPYRIPPECPVPVQRGECHGNFVRKEQCSFSWVSNIVNIRSYLNSYYNIIVYSGLNLVSNGLGASPGWGLCIVFCSKTRCSY